MSKETEINQKQVDYIVQRVNEIATSKTTILQAEVNKLVPAALNSNQAMYDCIVSGKAKLKPLNMITNVYWNNAFDYNYEPAEERTKKLDALKARIAAITKERDKIKDEAMLGDKKDLIKMLKEFTTKEF